MKALTDFLLTRYDEDWIFWPGAVDNTEIIGDGFVDAERRAEYDVQAKRLLVAHFNDLADGDDWADFAKMGLCLLALPYRDHPDYREEWRP